MSKSTLLRIKEIVEKLELEGDVNDRKLNDVIATTCGIHPKTIKNYRFWLNRLGYITWKNGAWEIDSNPDNS